MPAVYIQVVRRNGRESGSWDTANPRSMQSSQGSMSDRSAQPTLLSDDLSPLPLVEYLSTEQTVECSALPQKNNGVLVAFQTSFEPHPSLQPVASGELPAQGELVLAGSRFSARAHVSEAKTCGSWSRFRSRWYFREASQRSEGALWQWQA